MGKYKKPKSNKEYFLGSLLNKGVNAIAPDSEFAQIAGSVLGTGVDIMTGNPMGAIRNGMDGVTDIASLFMANGGELTEFNAGGSHEMNPNGGIPLGQNLVEQGETMQRDFVFSDRLKINKELAQEYSLPKKFIGKSFAELSKYYNDESRPNDAISKRGKEKELSNLRAAQESFKEVEGLTNPGQMMPNGGWPPNKKPVNPFEVLDGQNSPYISPLQLTYPQSGKVDVNGNPIPEVPAVVNQKTNPLNTPPTSGTMRPMQVDTIPEAWPDDLINPEDMDYEGKPVFAEQPGGVNGLALNDMYKQGLNRNDARTQELYFSNTNAPSLNPKESYYYSEFNNAQNFDRIDWDNPWNYYLFINSPEPGYAQSPRLIDPSKYQNAKQVSGGDQVGGNPTDKTTTGGTGGTGGGNTKARPKEAIVNLPNKPNPLAPDQLELKTSGVPSQAEIRKSAGFNPTANGNDGNNGLSLTDLRYAPLIGDIFNTGMTLLNKPELTAENKYDITRNIDPNLIDREQLRRNITSEAGATRQSLKNVSGNSGNLQANLQGVNRSSNNAIANANLQADVADNAEYARVDEFNFRKDAVNQRNRMAVKNMNDADKAAYRTMLMDSIANTFQNIGNIGTEEVYRNIAEGFPIDYFLDRKFENTYKRQA